MIFVILIGGIDLLVGFILVLFSVLIVGLIGYGVFVGIVIVLFVVLGGILGMLNGFFIFYGKLVLFIVILVIMIIFRGVMLVYLNGNLIIVGLFDSFLF